MKKLIKLLLLLFTIHLSLVASSAQSEQKAELVVQTGHSTNISAVAFSTNGKLIASAAGDRTVKLWDAESGLQIRDFKLSNSPYFQATDFARSDFGFGFEIIEAETPLSQFLHSQLSRKTLNLREQYDYKNPTPELLKALADDINQILKSGLIYTPERFKDVKLSPETSTLLEKNQIGDDLVKLNRLLLDDAFLRDLKKEQAYFVNLRFSPDESLLVGKAYDGDVVVWQVATGEELFSFSSEQAEMVFSPDGKLLAVSDYIGEIVLYDTITGFPVKRLKRRTEHLKRIENMQFTADGKKIISIEGRIKKGALGSYNPYGYDVIFWDLSTGIANLTASEQSKSTQYSNILSGEKSTHFARISGLNENATSLCYIYNYSKDRRLNNSSVFLINLETGVERKVFENNRWIFDRHNYFDDKILVFGNTIYSVQDGKKIKDIQIEKSFNAMGFNREGSKAAIASDNKISILNVNEGKVVKDLVNHAGWATARFSQDGKNLILQRFLDSFQAIDLANSSRITKFKDVNARTNKLYTVKAWDLKTGKNTETKEIVPQSNGSNIPFLAIIRMLSPDEKIIAIPDNNTISIGDAKDGQVIKELKGHLDEIKFVDFSYDGKILASGSDDNTIKLWDVEKGVVLHTFSDYNSPNFFGEEGKLPDALNSVAFSPDAKLLAGTTNNYTVTIWDVVSGTEKLKLNHGNDLIAVRFNQKGDKIATAADNGDIKIWEVATGKQILSIEIPSGEEIYSIAFSDDGKILVSGGTDKIIRLWDTTNGKLLREISGHTGDIHFVEIVGDKIGSEDSQPIVEIWDTEKGKIAHILKGYNNEIDEITFSPDRKLLAARGDSGIIRIWDVITGNQKFEFKIEKEVRILNSDNKQLAFSSDNTKIASLSVPHYEEPIDKDSNRHKTGYVYQLKVWSLKDRSEIYSQSFEIPSLNTIHLACDSKGEWLSIVTYGKLFLADTKTNQLPIELKKNSYDGEKAEFSPDGRYLVIGNRDGLIEIWSVETKKLVGVLKGHKAQITNFSFHPSGNILLSQSDDGTTRFWDLLNKREIGKLLLLDNDDWVVISPEGLFDSSTEARKLINYVIGNEPISLEQMKDVYYLPGLLQKIFKGEPLRKVELFSKKDLFPDVEFSQPKTGQLTVKLTNRGGGIGQVQIKINNKEFIADARPKNFDANTKETTLTVNLKDAPLVGGKANKIEVVARNASGSLTNRGTPRGTEIIDLSGDKTNTETPNIYAIVGGISNYTGDNLKLNFAAKDAEDFAKAIELGATKLLLGDKSKVHIRLLTSNGDKANVKFNVPDAKITRATKPDFEQAFADFKNATPNDVFIVYLSGHGVALNLNQNPNQAGGDTYLYLTQEAETTDKSLLLVENLRKATTISGEELKDLMKKNNAVEKLVLILDTCAAGAVANSLIGKSDLSGDQRKALETLKDNTGFFVLMGASASSESYEASQYGQGLLTYSLLRGMQGAKLHNDKFAYVGELFTYASKTVPDMAKTINGAKQIPQIILPDVSSDFPIGEFTIDERKQIVLSNPKPIILKPNLLNEKLRFDNLKLTAILREELRNIFYSKSPPIVFVEADEMTDAITPSGSYTVDGETLKIALVLVKNNEQVGKEINVTGKVSEKEALIKEIVAKLTEAANLKP